MLRCLIWDDLRTVSYFLRVEEQDLRLKQFWKLLTTYGGLGNAY